jgi:serine/threonine-protein kinase RsbW
MPKDAVEVDIKVPNQTRYLSLVGKIGEDMIKELGRYEVDRDTLAHQLNLVLTEAVANAIRYGNDSDTEQTVQILITVTADELLVKIYDNGRGFDINGIPSPDFESPKDQGRGIYIMKRIMDSVSYKKLEKVNVLEMSKKLK